MRAFRTFYSTRDSWILASTSGFQRFDRVEDAFTPIKALGQVAASIADTRSSSFIASPTKLETSCAFRENCFTFATLVQHIFVNLTTLEFKKAILLLVNFMRCSTIENVFRN